MSTYVTKGTFYCYNLLTPYCIIYSKSHLEDGISTISFDHLFIKKKLFTEASFGCLGNGHTDIYIFFGGGVLMIQFTTFSCYSIAYPFRFNSFCLSDQYDAIGWAPKEYNPDEKHNNNLEPKKDGSAANSEFVWDEKSGYYYDSASGFYYDGNTG
jgi:hypothetical protein